MTKFFYRAQKGDTLLSLSKRFNIPPSKLIKLNGLTRELEVGDMLYIEQTQEKPTLYVVRPFDSAFSVAKKFNLSEQELLDKNGVEYLFYGLILEL